jgi:hypothetical protein
LLLHHFNAWFCTALDFAALGLALAGGGFFFAFGAGFSGSVRQARVSSWWRTSGS